MSNASLDGEDAGASLDGSDGYRFAWRNITMHVRSRASQEQHVACFIAAARNLSLIAGVYLAFR